MSGATTTQAALDRARTRRAELAADVSGAAQALQDARTALKEGSGSAAQVTEAQSTHTALSEALRSLDGDILGLEGQLNQAQRQAERDAALQQLLSFAQGATKQLKLYGETMNEGNELLGPLVQRLIAAQTTRAQLRRSFLSELGALAGGSILRYSNPTDAIPGTARSEQWHARLDTARQVLSTLEAQGADLAAVLNPAFELDDSLHSMFDRPAPLPCPAPYGRALSNLCNPAAGMRLFPQAAEQIAAQL